MVASDRRTARRDHPPPAEIQGAADLPQQTMPTHSPPVDHAETARRNFWIAWAATLTFFAAFYALLTPLPRYLTAVGVPDGQIGLVLGAFGVAALLGRSRGARGAARQPVSPPPQCGHADGWGNARSAQLSRRSGANGFPT